jgi:hypothetical protein
MVRDPGGEKRLQRRVGLLMEIDDHVLCDIRKQRWSALWTQGVQEHAWEVWMTQTPVHGVLGRQHIQGMARTDSDILSHNYTTRCHHICFLLHRFCVL